MGVVIGLVGRTGGLEQLLPTCVCNPVYGAGNNSDIQPFKL